MPSTVIGLVDGLLMFVGKKRGIVNSYGVVVFGVDSIGLSFLHEKINRLIPANNIITRMVVNDLFDSFIFIFLYPDSVTKVMNFDLLTDFVIKV
jgi:hypothetical protein